MSATIDLFEQYKQFIGVQSDRLAAHALGVKSQTVSNWRTRGSQAEPWLIEAMCLQLGCDATPWLIRTLTGQASAHNRKVWERMAVRLGYRMTSWIALACVTVAGLLEWADSLGMVSAS